MAVQTQKREETEFDIKSEAYEWVEAVVFSVAVVVLVFTFFFRIVSVEGNSMLNTLQNGNRLVISNMEYKPKQGDIVVVSTKAKEVAGKPIIKRVIAVGGQTVRIDYQTGSVYVDDKKLSEPYIREPMVEAGNITYPVTVPAGSVFVMGDNRNDSFDSRFDEVGMIDDKNILGRAILRLMPVSEFGTLH